MKNVIRLTESDIRNMVKKTVTRIIKENEGNLRQRLMDLDDDDDMDDETTQKPKHEPKRVRRGHLEDYDMKENRGNFRQRLMDLDDDDDDDDDDLYDDDDDYRPRRMRRGSYYDD